MEGHCFAWVLRLVWRRSMCGVVGFGVDGGELEVELGLGRTELGWSALWGSRG